MSGLPMLGTNATCDSVSAGTCTARVNVIVTISPLLKPTMMGGGLDAMAVITPGQHSLDPSRAPSGDAHGRHVVADTAPTAALNVFASQAVQLSRDVAPIRSLYLPAGHGCRSPPLQ